MFGLGDFSINTVLTTLALLYVTHFLLNVVGLRPELAGAVQLIGRTVDAISDPAMGRLSDRCRWRWGRRRPFLSLGPGESGVQPTFFTHPWVVADSSGRCMAIYYARNTDRQIVVGP